MTETKEWKKVNPLEVMTKSDFLTLFEHLPLNLKEKERLNTEYWDMYVKFLDSNVKPQVAWEATRNLFILKESQIGKR
jgi:hypothetical protein